MRVLQLIDSLRPGGAERMAVSYANALSKRIDGSFLCCTRKEGLLRKKISAEVGYIFLKRRHTTDLQAIFRLRRFIKDNQIDLIQVHGSSVFLGIVVKSTLPDVKLIWHDHWGERALKKKAPGFLKPASLLFDGIISVNKDLQVWAERNLLCKHVQYIPNFLPLQESIGSGAELHGIESFKLICVANLKPPKDHLNLLEAFKMVIEFAQDVSLHLIGTDEQDSYAESVKLFIRANKLDSKVFLYGEQENVYPFITGAQLGVISSSSEGLPVSLLEYGQAGLPVVCTSVGECAEVLGLSGKLVPPGDADALAIAIIDYLKDKEQRQRDSRAFQKRVHEYFSEEQVIPAAISFFDKVDRQGPIPRKKQ